MEVLLYLARHLHDGNFAILHVASDAAGVTRGSRSGFPVRGEAADLGNPMADLVRWSSSDPA